MPKIYFAKKQLGSVTGAEVHVRYSYAAVFQGSVDTKLTDAINEGMAALAYTINYMDNTDSNSLNINFKRFFEKYYLSRNFTDLEMLGAIGSVLSLTLEGLSGTNTIKVYSKAENDPQKRTAGYVNNYFAKSGNQKHRNLGIYHGANGAKAAYKGDIHMGISTVKKGSQLSNAVTFIHEATHKYASTTDFGEKGYTSEFGLYREAGLTTAQALMNAESHARFVVHFYRAEKGMRQW